MTAPSVPVQVGDLVLDTVDVGPRDGEAVLMLHGFPQAARCWRGVWPALVDAGYRVVAPDQRGYSPGARPQAVEAYRMPELVGDAIGLLDALGIARAHLVGHDWGAAVSWHTAARHPDRIASLTAVSVPHPKAFSEALRSDPDQRERSQYIRLFQGEGSAEERLLADDGKYLREAFGEMADTGAYVARMREPGALTGALNWYRAIDAEPVLTMPALTVPTLYVWSDEDRALGPVPAHLTGSYVDAPYRFEVLHGVSHWIPEEASGQLSTLLLEHLATVTA